MSELSSSLNAPTGAWCSLTSVLRKPKKISLRSQCTYRCVVLPDGRLVEQGRGGGALSQCTYRCVVLPDPGSEIEQRIYLNLSQCTYRCVVLPDPCPRERRYDATSRARSATGPGSTPPDRPAPGSD